MDFKAFDINHDGFVDPQEVRVKNPYVSQEDVSLFFMESDKNEDGKVTLDEYLHTQYSNHDVVF